MKTMKALVAYGPHDYRFEPTHEVPKPGPEEVLVRVTAVGICAGDCKMHHGHSFYWGPGGRAKPPVIPGHEFVGTVVELGPGAAEKHGLKVGDQAVAEQLLVCHKCYFCNNDMAHKCDSLRIYGQAIDGAMAEFMVYRQGSFVHKVPEGLPPTHGVYAEVLAVSLHGIERGRVRERDVVIVSGCGSVGLGAVCALRELHPTVTVIALDRHDFKLAVAKKCGAHHTFNVDTVADLQKEVKDLCGERGGCDVYLEMAGDDGSVRNGMTCLRKCGTYVQVGFPKEEVPVNFSLVAGLKELNIFGSNLGHGCWGKAFDMLERGLVPVDDIVTHVLPLTDYVHGFDFVMTQKDSIKVVLDPQQMG